MAPTQSGIKFEPMQINVNGFQVHFAHNTFKISPTHSGMRLEPKLINKNILHDGFDLRKWPHSLDGDNILLYVH